MTFNKGVSGNPTGRKAGTPNKAAAAAREVISVALLDTDAATLQAKLAVLEEKDFIDAYVKLAKFITPKLQRTALAADETEQRIGVTMNLGDARQSLLDKMTAVKGVVE